MSLNDLLKQAKQRKAKLEEVEEQKKSAKQAKLNEELAIEQAAFEELLKKYVGDIFDSLDEAPKIEPHLYGQTVLRVNIFHRALSLTLSDSCPYTPSSKWSVRDSLRREYWDICMPSPPPKQDHQEYVSGDELVDYLLIRILEIAKEHDRLLIDIEKVKAKKFKEEEIEAKKREANERLRLFDKTLRTILTQSNEQLQVQIEKANAAQWNWPKDFVLDLYKVTWCIGSHRDGEYEEAQFDYDSGWSLTDVLVSEPEYFILLPERGRASRTVKTSAPLTVERIRVTESTLPDRLFDYPARVDIDTVDIEFTLDHFRHRCRLLPDFVPPLPEGVEVSLDSRTPAFNLNLLPCLEIRQAIDEIVGVANTLNDEVFDNNIPY